jgi:hypothetical protein
MINVTKRHDLYIDLQGLWTCPLSHVPKNEHASENVCVPFLGEGAAIMIALSRTANSVQTDRDMHSIDAEVWQNDSKDMDKPQTHRICNICSISTITKYCKYI